MSTTRRIFLRNGALTVVGTAAVPGSWRARPSARSIPARAPSGWSSFSSAARLTASILSCLTAKRRITRCGPPSTSRKNPCSISTAFSDCIPLCHRLRRCEAEASRHRACFRIARSFALAFDAQDFMESGTPGLKATEDGWLNRVFARTASASASRRAKRHSARPILRFPRYCAWPVASAHSFRQRAGAGAQQPRRFFGGREQSKSRADCHTLKPCMRARSDTVLHGTGQETFDAVKMLKSRGPGKYTPSAGANYPKGRFGDSLRQLAQLIKANVGVQVAFADIGGWDHHVNEGSTQGQIAKCSANSRNRLQPFGPTLAISEKTRSSSPCRNLGARRAKTAIAAPTTATPT